MRQFSKTIPAVQYVYGHYRLRRFRHAYGPEFSRLLDTAPSGVPPLHLANSLNQFEWLVHHRLFPPDLIERLMPPGPGPATDRAFANFTRGYVAEQQLAGEWQRSATISEAAERRLTEYLNRYVTYALRTFAVHLEVRGNPKSSDAIRIRRVLAELEGEDGELLDIGCARGRFLLRMAGAQPDWNYLGVEIRQPLVALAALADMGIGIAFFIARSTGAGAGRVVALTYEYGNAFLIVAGLMNMLVVLDAFDIAQGRK